MNMVNQEVSDWRWHIKHSIKTIDELNSHLPPSKNREQWLLSNFSESPLPFSVTPHFASLMSGEPDCPIFSQVISSKQEHILDDTLMQDPLGEEPRQVVPHLVHRYPDRVLFLATDRCASYCRFCQRKRWVGQGPTPRRDQQEEAFIYIEKNPQIKEVVFSGGDPLLLSNQRLNELLSRTLSIKHIELVRFHTRMLSFAPMRIDEELTKILSSYSPVYLVTHFNHPQEINQLTMNAISKLHQSGVALLNQAVLLKGINDDETILRDLFMLMARLKIRPYYLHQCDVITGSSHFRVPIKRSLELMSNLRGRISGHCLPTLVIDIPGGHGKVPLVKSPIVKEDDRFIYLEGFLGGVSAYPKE